MKKFNELTSIEKYKRLKRNGTAFKVGKWFSILSPFFIIGAVNFNEYFTEFNGVKMSLGCVLACIVGGIAIYNETKEESKKVSGLVGWAIAFALVYLMQSVVQDLVLIVGCGFLGQVVGAGFDMGADNQLTKAQLYKEAIIKADPTTNTNNAEKEV